MSYHRFSIIQGRAVIDKRVTNAQFRTLSALGMYADKDGWCFPSQSTVGDDLGKSRQTVNEDIAKLAEYGYVEKHSEYFGKELKMKYRLLFDSIPTGGVSENRQGVSELPDSNDPSNDSSNNTASDENRPLPDFFERDSNGNVRIKTLSTTFTEPPRNSFTLDELPVEWQIAAGVKEVKPQDQKLAQMKDAANLISMGCGSKQQQIYDLAWAFMQARDIVLLADDAKVNRKFAKQMAVSGVQPHHVVDAVHHLVGQGMTIVKMSSVAKTAISLANPTDGDGGNHYDYLEGL